MKVSLDGGETYQQAPQGVRVIYENLLMPGEDTNGELHINCTDEGLILDVWADNEENTNLGTSSQLVDDIVSQLIEDNS